MGTTKDAARPGGPVVLAAYVLTSRHVGATRAAVLQALEAAVAPLSATRGVQRVVDWEPEDVRRELERPAATAAEGGGPPPLPLPLVALDAATMDDAAMRPLVRGLHLREISNVAKHAEALRLAAALPSGSGSGSGSGGGAGPRFALVLEDDAVFGQTVGVALARAARAAPADADVVFLGLPSKRAAEAAAAAAAGGPAAAAGSEPVFDDVLQVFENHVLPACESYLVTPAAAARIAAGLRPVRLTATGMLTYLARRGVFRAYVVTPNVFVDGSKAGVTTSSLDANNRLLWHQGYCRMDALVRPGLRPVTEPSAPLGPQQRAAFEALWAEHAPQLARHPDALVLRGEFLERCGRVEDARAAYEAALEGYVADGCVVGSASTFMRRLIRTFSPSFSLPLAGGGRLRAPAPAGEAKP